MKAEIIAVGTELLMGTSENTNALFLSRKLALMGYEVHHQTVVGDNEKDIIDAVRIAVARSRLTILTGGLGPTDDDMTKEAVAKAFGFQLVEDAEVLEGIKAYFESKKAEMSENNKKQAMIIKGSDVLKNPNGTAPGIFIEGKEKLIVLMPGPPRETEPMFINELVPRLEKYDKSRTATASVHVFGIAESELEEKVKDLLYGENPTAALYAKTGEVHINIAARSNTKSNAKALVEKEVKSLKERIGDCVYCTDGSELHETVVKLLTETGIKISLAESCTGGLLASKITEVDGASKVFEYGMAAYADWVKQKSLDVDPAVIRRYTAVSSVTAAEMAKGAFENGQSDIGVGITGLAGPSAGDYVDKPVGLVYIAVADEEHVIVKKFNFTASRGRSYIREMCVKNALDMVRRFVLGLPIEGARQFEEKQLADLDREKPRSKSSIAVQRALVTVICAATVFGSVALAAQSIKQRMDENVYDSIKHTYSETSLESNAKEIDFTALTASNSDTVGWLWSENMAIDSVVVGRRSDSYYAERDFRGNTSSLGCLHLSEAQNLSSDADNTVIYGSSADTAQMFGPLLLMTDRNYLVSNYLFNYSTTESVGKYQVVSVFYANSKTASGAVQDFYTKDLFETNDVFVNFVIEAKMRSIINIETPIVYGDKFITLVTDVADWDGARLVVVAKRVADGADPTLASTAITKNMAPLYPEMYHTIKGTTSLINESNERDRIKGWLAENEAATAGKVENNGTVIEATGDGETPDTVQIAEGETALTVIMNGVEITDTPYNIVCKMVAYETSGSFTKEALKAQAVASITLLRYGFDDTGSPSVFGQTPTDEVKAAVSEVMGQCLYYDGRAAYTPSFQISALKTNAYDEVYSENAGAFPYLTSVASAYDSYVTGFEKTTNLTRDIVKTRIESYYNIVLSENTANWIVVTEKTGAGYAKTISIDGQINVNACDFAMNCLNIRSAYFTLTWSDNAAKFVTRGYGSGVGLSTYGANEYVKQNGWSYTQILEHYFPGTTLGEVAW